MPSTDTFAAMLNDFYPGDLIREEFTRRDYLLNNLEDENRAEQRDSWQRTFIELRASYIRNSGIVPTSFVCSPRTLDSIIRAFNEGRLEYRLDGRTFYAWEGITINPESYCDDDRMYAMSSTTPYTAIAPIQSSPPVGRWGSKTFPYEDNSMSTSPPYSPFRQWEYDAPNMHVSNVDRENGVVSFSSDSPTYNPETDQELQNNIRRIEQMKAS